MGKLENKVAFVTGASMGIGEGIARVLAEEGAAVALAARSTGKTKAIADELNAAGLKAMAVAVDVTDEASIKAAVAEVVKTYGRIDILVNNAGVCRLANFLDMTDEDRDFHIDVNIKGIWNTTRAVLPVMIENGYGKIVNMSSVTGPLVADEGETAYAMSKAAIYGFTKALARETAKYKINVNMIMPGYVMTPMAQSIARAVLPRRPRFGHSRHRERRAAGAFGRSQGSGPFGRFPRLGRRRLPHRYAGGHRRRQHPARDRFGGCVTHIGTKRLAP